MTHADSNYHRASLPLSGVRVLDLTRVLAGPLCTMMLGDLGGSILKVERPESGDDTRGWGPPFDDEGRSAYFLSVNRNKLSIACDLDLPEDRALIADLAAEAHVVVDNFRPGTLERRGLDPAAILARHPNLVWCTITGFGPEADRPGYDFVAQAECGWMAITGEAAGEPMKVGVALADVIAGKDAAISILAALLEVRSTGRGRRIFISLADSARAALVNVAQNALVSGSDARRWGNAHPNLVPYQLFHATDRPLVIAVGSDTQWVACARTLGLDELAADPSLKTNAGRVAQRDRVVAAMERALAGRPAADWLARLAAAGIPSGDVRSVLEVVHEASGSALTGLPSAVGGVVRHPPPGLDQHGALVRGAGWGAFESVHTA